MRIVSVEAFAVHLDRDHAAALGTAGSPVPLNGEGPYRWATTYPCLYSTLIETALVRVRLDNGLEGWGEAQAPLAPEVACAIVNTILRAAITGAEFHASAEAIATIWDRMYSTMRVRGQTGGFMLDAISGVDLALWDVAGKSLGRSVSALLGAARPSVPAYLSGVPAGDWDQARSWHASGIRAVKIYHQGSPSALLAEVARAGEIFGRGSVAVDALWRLTPPEARELCAQLRGIMFLECPFPPEETEWHIDLARSTDVPLALGESYRTRYELHRLVESGVVRFLQPDLGRCGITEALRIADLARPHDIGIIPHVSIAQAPQLAAAIHFASAVNEAPMMEFNPAVLQAANRFIVDPLVVQKGSYLVPPGPGLGIRFQASAPWISARSE